MTIVTNGAVGVDLAATVTGTGTSYDQGNEFALGTPMQGTDGQRYVYAHASAAIAQYDWVGIDENWEAAPLTKAMADDGWAIGRNANGTLKHDPELFPHGIKPVADYVHSKGMLFGIYTARGSGTCMGRPGSVRPSAPKA